MLLMCLGICRNPTISADSTGEWYHDAKDNADFLHQSADIGVKAIGHRHRGRGLEGRLKIGHIHPRRYLDRAVRHLELCVHAARQGRETFQSAILQKEFSF